MNVRAGPIGRTPEPADAGAATAAPSTGQPLNLDAAILRDVSVAVRVRLGEATLRIEELMALKADSLLKLDRMLNEPVELYLNEALIGRGEIVAVDDCFGVRVTEIAAQ